MFILIILNLTLCVIFCNTEDDTLNGGTVLFRKSDLSRECWPREMLTLLTYRCAMQHILPNRLVNVNNEKYIDVFINHIYDCLTFIQNNTDGTTQHNMILALADTVGGYIRTYLLPVTTEAYYVGNIRFSEVNKLYSFYEKFKRQLQTDGSGWRSPSKSYGIRHNVRSLLILDRNKLKDPCKELLIHDKPGVNCNTNKPKCSSTKTSLFIPFLDDAKRPQSVVLPLKSSVLHSLSSSKSAYLITIHYVKSITCLKSLRVSIKDMCEYNLQFSQWLLRDVLPRLNDENWYPAFGGILKVIKSTKKLSEGRNLKKHTATRRSFELLTSDTTNYDNDATDRQKTMKENNKFKGDEGYNDFLKMLGETAFNNHSEIVQNIACPHKIELPGFITCLVASLYFQLNYCIVYICALSLVWIALFLLHICTKDLKVTSEEQRIEKTVSYVTGKLRKHPDRYYTIGTDSQPKRIVEGSNADEVKEVEEVELVPSKAFKERELRDTAISLKARGSERVEAVTRNISMVIPPVSRKDSSEGSICEQQIEIILSHSCARPVSVTCTSSDDEEVSPSKPPH